MTKDITTPDIDDIEVRIYKKTLRRVIPIIMLGMFISYIDRANIGVLAGPMSEDLGLSAATFGLAAGLFYIGYCFFEVPSNMALARFGARIWLARIMVSWGICTMLMAFVQNDITLYIVRIMLGIAEAGFSPGALLFLAFWCPPRMLPKTYSMLNLAVPIALAIGSILTSSLLSLDGLFGVAGWRWAFLIEGIPAIALAAYMYFRLPNGPSEATWLDDEEKDYLAEHSAQRPGGPGHEMKYFWAVLRRPAAWAFTVLYFCMTIGYWTIAYFLPTIVRGEFKLGFIASGLVSAIPWTFAAIVMVLVSKNVSKTGERTWHMTILQIAGAVGLATAALSGNPYLALIGISLAAGGFFGSLPSFNSMPTQVFTAGLAAVALAMINGLASLSGLVGPYLFGLLQDTTGSTDMGLLIMSGFFVAAAVLVYCMSRWTDTVTGGLHSTPAVDTDPASSTSK
ncbi:MFS transporter [Rhodococcus sp. Leaf278]|uniref:MFS transporter n=1 Tax=Rhodococcus sp. Leaf278 TaxID=1736319 RepID=UPI00070C23B4|nr:MFS transporter [Rhodococcus sp. Leaf278]KQU45909.1 MFS transporter [Rhodococcus sp. Leaf278]